MKSRTGSLSLGTGLKDTAMTKQARYRKPENVWCGKRKNSQKSAESCFARSDWKQTANDDVISSPLIKRRKML